MTRQPVKKNTKRPVPDAVEKQLESSAIDHQFESLAAKLLPAKSDDAPEPKRRVRTVTQVKKTESAKQLDTTMDDVEPDSPKTEKLIPVKSDEAPEPKCSRRTVTQVRKIESAKQLDTTMDDVEPDSPKRAKLLPVKSSEAPEPKRRRRTITKVRKTKSAKQLDTATNDVDHDSPKTAGAGLKSSTSESAAGKRVSVSDTALTGSDAERMKKRGKRVERRNSGSRQNRKNKAKCLPVTKQQEPTKGLSLHLFVV